MHFRPDYRLQDNYARILERGEIKKNQDLFLTAREELVNKCFELNPHQYADIDVIFGFVLCGNMYYLYLIDFKLKCVDSSKCYIFNL